MVNELLFEIPETLSPKLAWMRKYSVELFRAENSALWYCRRSIIEPANHIGAGETGDDAILDWCEKSGIPHWSVQQ